MPRRGEQVHRIVVARPTRQREDHGQAEQEAAQWRRYTQALQQPGHYQQATDEQQVGKFATHVDT